MKCSIFSYRKSKLSVSDVIAALEDDPDFFRADIHMTPPGDGLVSDEDSADEDSVSPDNLSGNQLRAQGEATVFRYSAEKERIGVNDTAQPSDDDDDHPTNIVQVSLLLCSQQFLFWLRTRI